MPRIAGLVALVGISSIFAVGCSAPAEGDPTASGSSTSTGSGTSEPAAVPDAFASVAKPIIDKSCLGCHSGAEPKGNIDMAKFATETDAKANLETIHKMVQEIEAKKMPPPNSVPLSDEDRAKLVDALKALG